MTATPKIDLIAHLNDEEWLAEALRVEEEWGGEVSAGYDRSSNFAEFLQHPDRHVRSERRRSLVMSELRSLLKERQLENGLEIARQILDRHLQKPSLEIQERLLNAIEQDITMRKCSSTSTLLSDYDPVSIGVKVQIKQVIQEILSAEDWHNIEFGNKEIKTRTPQERIERVLIWLSRLNRWEIDFANISKQTQIAEKTLFQWQKQESFPNEIELQIIENFGKEQQAEVRNLIGTALQELATYFWNIGKDRATWSQFDEWVAKEIGKGKSEVKILRTHLDRLQSPEIAVAKSLETLRDRTIGNSQTQNTIP